MNHNWKCGGKGKPLRSQDKTVNACSVLKSGSLNMISRTRGPDWSWCWSSRRTSCSGWPQRACCACWVESAGWPSPGAPPGCCPPRERSELEGRSQLPHLDLALLSKDLQTTSLVRPKPVLGVNFHLRERCVPEQKSIKRKVFYPPDTLCQRSPYIRQELQGWPEKKYSGNISSQVVKSCRRRKKNTKANHLLDQSVVGLAATNQEGRFKQLAKPLRRNSVFVRRLRKKRWEFYSVYSVRDSWL